VNADDGLSAAVRYALTDAMLAADEAEHKI
jgi:hypothetical protein